VTEIAQKGLLVAAVRLDRLAAMSRQEDSRALIPVAIPPVDQGWRTILQAQNQVVLYNPTSHALSIRPSVVHQDHLPDTSLCPYCNRPLPTDNEGGEDTQDRVANYFQLLEVSNDVFSRPSTPPVIEPVSPAGESSTFAAETMAQGYFHAFFEEECRLGMGADGSVFLCQVRLQKLYHATPSHDSYFQHVLDGNRLGTLR
jgi:hypothetical protein